MIAMYRQNCRTSCKRGVSLRLAPITGSIRIDGFTIDMDGPLANRREVLITGAYLQNDSGVCTMYWYVMVLSNNQELLGKPAQLWCSELCERP